MAKYIRYALASVCFAASVGCLALWWRSYSVYELQIRVSAFMPERVITIALIGKYLTLGIHPDKTGVAGPFRCVFDTVHPEYAEALNAIATNGRSNEYGHLMYFLPLWYPALVVALAGVGVLRFRRQFSIRSVLVATTVGAVLIGIAVAL